MARRLVFVQRLDRSLDQEVFAVHLCHQLAHKFFAQPDPDKIAHFNQ